MCLLFRSRQRNLRLSLKDRIHYSNFSKKARAKTAGTVTLDTMNKNGDAEAGQEEQAYENTNFSGEGDNTEAHSGEDEFFFFSERSN